MEFSSPASSAIASAPATSASASTVASPRTSSASSLITANCSPLLLSARSRVVETDRALAGLLLTCDASPTRVPSDALGFLVVRLAARVEVSALLVAPACLSSFAVPPAWRRGSPAGVFSVFLEVSFP
mmetsp:Transcript_14232/g.42906  ORF Transcript_14232/g.42906 Transcript_14232/m.42906 type:complete len:128 (-) Transcript_14232:316-699(-)